jgi:hypothetical protein
MMKTKIVILLFTLTLGACSFSKSVKVDLLSGLTAKGDLISCDDVYLTVNGEKVNSNVFTYGEEFYLNFNKIEGFKRENERVFPGMDLIVTNTAGDTMLYSTDMYKNYPEGINLSPLLLQSNITVADPIHSNMEYILTVNLNDKKDKGTFNAKLNFKVVPNDKILLTSNNVSYKEIYLFSANDKKVITNNKVKLNDKVYLLFEGLSGFKDVNGYVYPGLSIKASDEAGEQLLNYEDLFSEYSETGIAASDFASQVSSNLVFSSPDVKNPIHCTITIWDKKGESKISAAFDLQLEQ